MTTDVGKSTQGDNRQSKCSWRQFGLRLLFELSTTRPTLAEGVAARVLTYVMNLACRKATHSYQRKDDWEINSKIQVE